MPGPLRNPDRSQIRRRNIEPPPTVLCEDGELRGCELPKTREWPVETQVWWDVWRRSPQAQRFTATDWSYLLDTALCHARFWSGDQTAGSELRLRVTKFGATVEDRIRMRMQIVDDLDDAPSVASDDDKANWVQSQRERLQKSVGL